MPSTDNFPEVEAAIRAFVAAVRLDNGNFGTDLLDVITDDIEENAGRQQAPDGMLWKRNDPRYAASKGFRPVGVKSGLMLARPELIGERKVMPDRAEITYGVSEEARSHASGFEAGGRPLWDISEDAERAMVRRTGAFLDDLVDRLGF